VCPQIKQASRVHSLWVGHRRRQAEHTSVVIKGRGQKHNCAGVFMHTVCHRSPLGHHAVPVVHRIAKWPTATKLRNLWLVACAICCSGVTRSALAPCRSCHWEAKAAQTQSADMSSMNHCHLSECSQI
jgi:hypothetical protein